MPEILNTLNSQITTTPYYTLTSVPPVDGPDYLIINNDQSGEMHFITLPDGQPGFWVKDGYTMTLSQSVDLPNGGTVSGWARYWSADYPPFFNFASVTVNGLEAWRKTPADLKDKYGYPFPAEWNWDEWSITVPAGTCTIELTAGGSSPIGGIGMFDGITVLGADPSPVADAGSTVALLGLACLGMFGLSLCPPARRPSLRN